MVFNQLQPLPIEHQGSYVRLVSVFECVYHGDWLLFAPLDNNQQNTLFCSFDIQHTRSRVLQTYITTGIDYAQLEVGVFYEVLNSTYLQMLYERGHGFIDYRQYKHVVVVTQTHIIEGVARRFPEVPFREMCEHRDPQCNKAPACNE